MSRRDNRRRREYSLIVLGLFLGVAGAVCPAWKAAAQTPAIQCVRVRASSPLVDPGAQWWQAAPKTEVTMLPQTITAPTNPQAAVHQLLVQAAHNGEWLAFRIEWEDPTQSDVVLVDRFGDQVAVELPNEFREDALPSPMMGNPGARVTIMQWRAPFQRDLDYGEPQVRDLYPYALVDVYPDQVLSAIDARPYMGAVGVDNPISHPRQSPVLDQMAEGWGTMTVKAEQHADGRGVWKEGRWAVVIARPLKTGSKNDPQLSPGAKTVAAFAVWEGGNREVGSRKAWSSWIPVQLAE